MKKITILMLHLKNGGIETQTLKFANELAKRYLVEIISVYNIGNTRAIELDNNIKVKYLIEYGPNKQEFISAVKKLNIKQVFVEAKKAIDILYKKRNLMIKEIEKLDTDIVFSTRIEFAELLSNHCSDNIVKYTAEHQHKDTKKYVKKVRKACKNIDYLALLGNESVKYYKSWLSDNKKTKIVVIPNIIDEIDERNSNLENNTLSLIARLHKVKRIDLTLQVIKKVKEKIKDVKLNIIGGGEEETKLKDLTKKLNLEDTVNFTGMIKNKEALEIVRGSSLYIMNSKTECMPMVLIEAFSCGVPAIAFDVPVGPRAIITNNVDGILIEDNNVEKMAKKIVELFENRDKLKKLGENAKTSSYKYLAKNVMPMWFELFDKGEI